MAEPWPTEVQQSTSTVERADGTTIEVTTTVWPAAPVPVGTIPSAPPE